MRVCLRYRSDKNAAAELLNQGFLKVLTNLAKAPEIHAFVGWTKRVTINVIIDHFRKEKRYRTHEQHYENFESAFSQSVVDFNSAAQEMDAAQLRALIDRLPEPRRQIFNLHAIDGFSHNEIALMLGIPVGTSKWHLAQARQWMQERIHAMLNQKKLVKNESVR